MAFVYDAIDKDIGKKLCDNMDDFRIKFAKVFKKTAIAQQLRFGFDRL